MKIHATRTLVNILALVSLAGCTLRIPSFTTVSDTPAPTTMPIATAAVETANPIPDTGAEVTLPAASPAPSLAATAPPSVTELAVPVEATEFAGAVPTAAPVVNPPQRPIQLPPGFTISVYASGLDSPRMMTIGPDGALYVAERGAGRILRLVDANGQAGPAQVVAEGLNAPSSLAFYQDGSLYVGETTRVVRLSQPNEQGVFTRQDTIISGLPRGGHSTRTVLFSPDWSTLFVSIGSSCNVCQESDDRRAAIMRYDPDGKNGQLYARGLRNAVGITFRPGSDELWATNNGRDLLGDDQPPETVNLVRQGDDFGWPRCHAGRIVDPDFGGQQGCTGVAKPAVEMQAHSAPLGLTFYNGKQFPAEYQGDLFVAFHGSWNRSVPTGYKVVRIHFSNGAPGPAEDFATGWLDGSSSWGRPVDVKVGLDGSLFVSDDGGGIIYRIFYSGGQ